jgi:hypothetical protein
LTLTGDLLFNGSYAPMCCSHNVPFCSSDVIMSIIERECFGATILRSTAFQLSASGSVVPARSVTWPTAIRLKDEA